MVINLGMSASFEEDGCNHISFLLPLKLSCIVETIYSCNAPVGVPLVVVISPSESFERLFAIVCSEANLPRAELSSSLNSEIDSDNLSI